MYTTSRKYTALKAGAQNTSGRAVGILLLVFIAGLLASGCATVDATVDKVKAGVSDRFGKEEEAEADGLQAVEGSAEPAKPLKKPLLVEVQEKLRTLGYYSGPISGSLDSQTEAAIQDFQLDHDLRINGRPSKPLLSELNKALELI